MALFERNSDGMLCDIIQARFYIVIADDGKRDEISHSQVVGDYKPLDGEAEAIRNIETATEEQAAQESETSDKGFFAYLKRASEIVNSWPKWKGEVLGTPRPKVRPRR